MEQDDWIIGKSDSIPFLIQFQKIVKIHTNYQAASMIINFSLMFNSSS